MGSHETRNVTFLHTFYTERFDHEIDYELEVNADVDLFTDPCYGMDADGNRGQIKTEVNEITINTIWLHVPGRDKGFPIRFHKEADLSQFLTDDEIDTILATAGEKAWGR
jgi:hypothetical protein